MENEILQDRHIKSYVVRAGRITAAQTRALTELGPKYLVAVEEGKYLNPTELFGREAPLVVEIGFGMGKSFTQMAQADPNSNYLGIEVHPPGVGSALMLVEELGLKNVRIIQHDAFEIFKHHLSENSIDILQIFFPDPWPKKRHFKRRLINDDFIAMVAASIKHGGYVRLATDWEEYAMQMLDVMTRAEGFTNTASDGRFIERPAWRPLTKFELRGERLGHGVWDLVFKRD